jgi:hypothetical protein
MSGQWRTEELMDGFMHANGSFTMNIMRYRQHNTNAKITLKIIDGHYYDDHQIKIVAPFSTSDVKQVDNK